MPVVSITRPPINVLRNISFRSRSVSCFTEPLKLNGEIVLNGGHLFSFDIDELVKDELVESIYQKTRSGNGGNKEAFQKIEPQAINYTPLDFSKYTTEYELTHAFFRHYMIVLKDGFIPPKYLTLEKSFSQLFI